MAIMIYQHRTLVSTAGYDQVSGKWKYAATVSWSEIGSITRFHFVATSPSYSMVSKRQRKPDCKLLNPG
jgi:hypothetical protein